MVDVNSIDGTPPAVDIREQNTNTPDPRETTPDPRKNTLEPRETTPEPKETTPQPQMGNNGEQVQQSNNPASTSTTTSTTTSSSSSEDSSDSVTLRRASLRSANKVQHCELTFNQRRIKIRLPLRTKSRSAYPL